ncbi:MAG: glycoside hydrolase family 3 protein [Salinivirgaceae bacterium]|jgi:beta-N-acetylhexosaminidase|nr:glycoside hydrolase family 3 protein [Salinivirgaceae bacterium]
MKTLHKNFFLIACYTIVLVTTNGIINAQTQSEGNRPEAIDYDYTPKDTSWKALTIREKIGQTMIVLGYYENYNNQFGSIDNMIKKYPVGGVFIPAWSYGNYQPQKDVVKNIQKCMQEYEDASKYPMIITEDFERGVGSVYDGYTDMPVLMSLGAANKPELSQKYGNTTAKEASTLGVNWLLHPVSDLNINPLQNLVVERAVSDDANRAYPLLKAQMQGMKDAGVVPTIKHFPGDGSTMKNQHLITSDNNMSMAEWNSSYGTLFQNLINDGTPCIMVGHIRFPAYQTKRIKGLLPPATLSEELMVGLLKEKMKFNGVIMSDALNMGGCGGYYPNIMETAVECFKAGVDLVLWPELSYMDTVEARINRGEIPMSRLDDAVERIWGVREKFNLLEKKEKLFNEITETEKEEIKNAIKEVAENAVTLVSDNAKEIPLKPETTKKIAIINISHNDMTQQLGDTKQLLEEKGFEVGEIIHNPNLYAWQGRLSEFEQYDKVIVAFENRYLAPIGASMLKDAEAMGIWTANMIPFEKMIAISYSNPYYVNYYLDYASIKINAYSMDNFSQKAVVDALTGAIPFVGTTPVKLDSPIMK